MESNNVVTFVSEGFVVGVKRYRVDVEKLEKAVVAEFAVKRN